MSTRENNIFIVQREGFLHLTLSKAGNAESLVHALVYVILKCMSFLSLRFFLSLFQVHIWWLVHAPYCSKIEVPLLLGRTMPTSSSTSKRWALVRSCTSVYCLHEHDIFGCGLVNTWYEAFFLATRSIGGFCFLHL